MFTEGTYRFVWAIVIVMLAVFTDDASALEEHQSLKLSKALAQVKLFAGLSDKERDDLKAAAVLRHGTAGERIIQQGKTMDRIFIILEGKADVRVNGKHIVTLSAQPLVGEVEFLDMLPASADVLLPEEADLIELNYAALNRLMENQPGLGYKLMREIATIEARRLRDTNLK